MANMSYCAFENTLNDFRMCLALLRDAAEDDISLQAFVRSRSSMREGNAVLRLAVVAAEMVDLVESMKEEDV